MMVKVGDKVEIIGTEYSCLPQEFKGLEVILLAPRTGDERFQFINPETPFNNSKWHVHESDVKLIQEHNRNGANSG